jgi:urease accessory protein
VITRPLLLSTLNIRATVARGAHGLLTTPGATRFYRSSGEPALQQTHLRLEAGVHMEWLPLETILYSGCKATNRLIFDLAPDAELIGWDITALGLPHAGQAFTRGQFCQHIEMPGVWLERGVVDARDTRWLNSPLALAGQHCITSIFFAAGSAMDRARRELALDSARQVLGDHALNAMAGATSPNPQVVVLRALALQVEPARDLLKKVWAAWRQALWHKAAAVPRVWVT